ncbi:pseudouridine synthase 1 [Dermatophagoides pteronyssinus]|uniref:Pseudouridylate synthase 1 homolog n=1 Tax=Dermatophagoides pteronyssinus TaxID=6956 RepID=A0A6P6YN19_DERPT|nr:tRNA pseudouridine synthase A-like [Dermatophagoides pteronyssinus]
MKLSIETMVKAKKWVVCLGYSGRGYYGMQAQRRDNKVIDEFPTIESELFKAFLQTELINENEYHNPSLMYFQRAARTDKGVSALKQIISMNSNADLESYIPRINEKLPKQIRIFGAKRTTKYFDSKTFCDCRTYSYLMPSFTIDKNANESYRVSQEMIEKFNSILNKYVGTHNFHNFTSQKKPLDPSAKRYIISFDCSQPFLLKNSNYNDDNENDGDQKNDVKQMEFIVVRVKGQSFMLHQIRKMIGLAVAIMRGFVDQNIIERAFSIDRIDIPMAPGLGLMLEEAHFEQYNKKYGGDGIHVPIIWDEFNDSIYDLKNQLIYPEIVDNEIKESSMTQWLSTLHIHTYDIRDHENIIKTKRSSEQTKNEEETFDGDNVNEKDYEDSVCNKKIKSNPEST